jgi:hypothetical protein
MAKSKYKVTQPETMTYEQAVATALLNVLGPVSHRAGQSLGFHANYRTRTLAYRRLRVRAGLTP